MCFMADIARRGFLKLLGSTAAGATGLLASAAFDPERLLWVPGRKTIFLPSRPPNRVRDLMEEFIASHPDDPSRILAVGWGDVVSSDEYKRGAPFPTGGRWLWFIGDGDASTLQPADLTLVWRPNA